MSNNNTEMIESSETATNMVDSDSTQTNVDTTNETTTNTMEPTADTSAEPSSQPVAIEPICTGSLDLAINDPHGDPIPDLYFKILIKGQIVFSGKSNAKGKIQTINNLKLGSVFEVHVRTDIGNYKKVAIGKIESVATYACLTSPKTRFEFSTYAHEGAAGTAAAHKANVIKQHNQTPADKPTITGNTATKPSITDIRNQNGHPVAAVIDGLSNWYNMHNDTAAHPPQAPLNKLHTLVEFMEHQATLDYTKLGAITSDQIITKMRNKTFEEPATKLATATKGWCAKYVKVGLWYAGYGSTLNSIGSGVSIARSMGPALVEAGFQNISTALPKVNINVGQQLIEQPDITFTLPGDVIVYQKIAAPTEAGHIDVRTYHGFISDFIWPGRNGFPDVRHYKVIGVYRKYSDTLAEARVKAFLRIIREHEAKGYADPYRALHWDGKQQTTFTDMSRHPYEVSNEDKPAGAYQLRWFTFKQAVAETGWPNSFTPLDQDRVAIYELQRRNKGASQPKRTALGYILEGKVEQAVNDTKLWKLFAFLPNGSGQQIDMPTLIHIFDTYIAEFAK